ncbi:MAG: choice-of-anchor Q domain-containing protein [Nannocystaceae bacterium]
MSRSRVRLFVGLLGTLGLASLGCGDEAEGSDAGGGPVDPTQLEPLGADCEPLAPVELGDAVTRVANEDELRQALAGGGSILLTADIQATAPFPVSADAVVDGGGFAVDGGGSTHLFVTMETVRFTIQNVTLRNASNTVSDDEHFSYRSGAAIMARGFTADGQPGSGALTVIDVTFENNRTKASGPGDIRGGAVYGFVMPDVTISGSTFVGNVGSNGGAIGGLGSSFSIIDSVFVANETNGPGAGGELEGHGGAISLDAVSQNRVTAYLNICGSRFEDNVASNGGGAIYLIAHHQTGTEVTIDQSLFTGNRSTSSSEGQGGAVILMDDDKHAVPASPAVNRASVTNSAFVDNETQQQGGAFWYWTGGGSLVLGNVTWSNNRVRDDMGMGGALAVARGPVAVVHNTFADNYARFHGGGIQASPEAMVSLRNTLFSNNTSNREGGWANFHTNRPLQDDGGNLQFLAPDLVIDTNSDAPVAEGVTRADPQLGPLQDNGGPTPTRALPAGSPAVDAGVSDGALSTDQRGTARQGAPDIGAFELAP